MHRPSLLVWVLTLACTVALVTGVNPGVFKGCSDSSVCRRFRKVAENVESFTRPAYVSPYSLGSVPELDGAALHVPVMSALHDVSFELKTCLLYTSDAADE